MMRELSHGETRKLDSKALKRLVSRGANSLRFAELADTCRRAGALSEATALCARGLLRYPNYATGYVVLGEIFCARNLTDKAREQWRKALELDPHHPRAHFRLAELHLSAGEQEKAVAELEMAVQSDPNFAEAHFLLAELKGETRAPDDDVETADALARPARRPQASVQRERYSRLLASLEKGCCVRRALIADSNGLPVASSPAWASSDGGDAEAAAGVSSAMIEDIRQLVSPLGAGKLEGMLLCGEDGAVRCVVLGADTLIADLDPEAPLGAVEAEIAEAIAGQAATEVGSADGGREELSAPGGSSA